MSRLRTAPYATAYARAGFELSPVREHDKRPYLRWDHAEARWRAFAPTSDVETVARLWARFPYASIRAVVPPGVVVVDIDPHNGATLRPEHLPETLTVRSGHGWHLYYRHPPAVTLDGSREAFPGVDLLRPPRQTVLLPPSLHRCGRRYEWANDVAPVELPGRIADAFAARTRRRGVPSSSSDRYVRAAREGVRADLAATAGPGSHHWPLLRASYRFRDLGFSEDDALGDLLPLVPLHDESEAVRTVRSVFR